MGDADDERCAQCKHYHGQPRGAGDVVHAMARATGIAAVASFVSGGDCSGCSRRRSALNAAIPFTDEGI